MSKEFEEIVISKLELIESKANSLESKIDEVVVVANKLSSMETFFEQDGANQVADQVKQMFPLTQGAGAMGLGDLIGSLKDFRKHLGNISEVISEQESEPDKK